MDYEKAYTNAVTRAKQAIKDSGDNEGRIRMIEDIFPELADPDRIRQELIRYIQFKPHYLPNGKYSIQDFLNWLEKQGERNNIVEQLTAFAQHLQKRGAFRDDLCMDFEHEAQSFIEMQNNKELCNEL